MSALLIIILLLVSVAFAIGGLRGAPYVPVMRRDTKGLLDLTGLRAGQTLVDLGSGDGRLLRAAAARGIHCIGYEINPILVLLSRILCFRQRRLITIRQADIWTTSLPQADAIYVFLMPRFMPRLHQKFTSELTQPTHIVSYVFEIPGFKPAAHQSSTYLYQYIP